MVRVPTILNPGNGTPIMSILMSFGNSMTNQHTLDLNVKYLNILDWLKFGIAYLL